LAGTGFAVLLGIYLLGSFNKKPTTPQRAQAAALVAATMATPPAAPTLIEIGLDSIPSGASVFVDDILVGTTPTIYKTVLKGEPVEFTFHVQGFEPEKIRAMAAPGLTVTAKFATATKHPASARRKRAAASRDESSTDIQTER
jgi:hypothetical protein